MAGPDTPLHVVLWGTYDRGKPRVRILERGLRESGARVSPCHTDVWGTVEDKSQIQGLTRRLRLVLRWLLAYPGLIWRYLRLPRHDLVLVCYLGQLDVLVLWPFARLRGVPILWDAFLSLYDTVVDDRRLVSPRHPLAALLYGWEWLACRAAKRVILDTQAHAAWFETRFQLPKGRVTSVLVGAETDRFHPHPSPSGPPSPREAKGLRVLFYGQFIALHGIDTIVRAARLCNDQPIDWTLIGSGQEAPQIRAMIAQDPPSRLTWVPWVEYAQLIDWIHGADVCLGIFGTSDKAARVIPNKVFQIIAADRPLITRDSPAIRELLSPGPGVTLIPAGSPESLAGALIERVTNPGRDAGGPWVHDPELRHRISPTAIGTQLDPILRRTLETDP